MHSPDMLLPRVLRLLLRVDPRQASLAHPAQHIHDPFRLRLDAARPVAEGRRRLGPVQEEEVGEAGCCDAHVRW